MNAAENDLIQLLTGKPTLQTATIEAFENAVVQYPYFSIAQLLFTKKLKATKHEHYARQFAKCSLFFPDEQWLDYLLNIEENAIEPEQNFLENTTEIITPAEPEINHETVAALTQNAEFEKNLIEDNNLITLPAEEALTHISLQLDDVAAEEELPPANEDEPELPENITGIASTKIASLLQHQAEDFKVPVQKNTQLPVSHEPYHTIDYFASQGIKTDLQSQDVLAKKVHKFTDWLKQMKRINQYPADLGSDPEMESFVQAIADTSNQPKDIFTEAMAEVLAMQGKTDKALQVYEKLSLHNPDKTAYFAAKIHQLKEL